MRIAGAALAFSLIASLAPRASADPEPADGNAARADLLFNEAQSMLAAGDLEPACAKFEESLKLNRQAIGTLLNVARCDARLGRMATAVALYAEARDRGREQHLDVYIQAAVDQLGKLTPLVPHLAITLTHPRPSVQIKVDDQPVTPLAAVDLQLDPGAHTVVVSDGDHAPFTATVKLHKSEHQTLAVPELGQRAEPGASGGHAATSSKRTVGKLLVIGGGVVTAAGISLGVVAKLHYDDADCMNGRCSADGVAKTQSARSLGNAGTIVGVAGVAVAAVGVVVWLTSPRAGGDRERAVAIAPYATADEAGIVAAGHF